MECVFDKSGTDGVECSRKVASGRRVANATRFVVECARVLYETLLVPIVMEG